MSEEQTAPQNEDTPQGTPAPVEDTAAEDQKVVDYRARYDNLLPEFTKKSQRLKELEAQLAERDQYSDEDDYEDEEYDTRDLERLIDQKMEAALSKRERVQNERQQEIAYVNAEIKRIEKENSEDFSDDEFDLIGRVSEDLRNEDGRPDVERAYEYYSNLIEGRKKKWYSGKKSARPASGPGATEVVDLDDSHQRAEFIDRIMEANIDPD